MQHVPGLLPESWGGLVAGHRSVQAGGRTPGAGSMAPVWPKVRAAHGAGGPGEEGGGGREGGREGPAPLTPAGGGGGEQQWPGSGPQHLPWPTLKGRAMGRGRAGQGKKRVGARGRGNRWMLDQQETRH